ncbi:MAG: gamma-glutamylcyclotransferase [Candidatus Cloacimonetes bacterium]|nr:gamma-glutamylcyclotransferase [Candidatus Cloacimonadota bacterium]
MIKSRKILATYGSLMNEKLMHFHCPKAKKFGTTMLKDHRLVFRGTSGSSFANIEPAEGFHVPILLWEISEKDEKEIDFYEDAPSLYRKEIREFDIAGEPVPVLVYTMVEGHALATPSEEHFMTIREGFMENSFDCHVLQAAILFSDKG